MRTLLATDARLDREVRRLRRSYLRGNLSRRVADARHLLRRAAAACRSAGAVIAHSDRGL